MRTGRGFTLIEMAIVVAVVAVLAAVGGSYLVASRRNAGVAAAATGVQMRLEQLQYMALSEQTTQVLVVADVPNNSATACGTIRSAACARVFHLRNPNATWKLNDFDVDHAANNVDTVVDEERLGDGVRFHLAGVGAPIPKPFDAYGAQLQVFDPDVVGLCKTSGSSDRKCVAFRFLPNGKVSLEYPDPSAASTALKSGTAFALGSELSRAPDGAATSGYAGALQQGVLIAVPSGITRSFPVP
jgi:prepilin-type N-terminal cleavage/methylation domain-containing protein